MCKDSTLDAIGFVAMRTFVFALVWGTSVSSVFFVIFPSVENWFFALLFASFVLWTAYRTTVFYLLTANTDPGRLPQEDWTPSVDELRLIQSVVGHKSWPEIRDAKQIAFCKHCNRHRPLRAHHCSDCNRCVLKQDHHCPWVTNCVGHHNHKYFVNFMGHGILGLAYVLLWVIIRAFQVFNGEKLPSGLPNIAPGTVITMAVDGILSVSLMLAISMLFSYQMWLLGINSTTIEHYDYSRRKRYAKKHGTKFIYPFSHGWKNNLRTILGRSYVDWVSTSKTEGDGLHEEISHEFLHSLDKGQTHFNVFEPDSEDTRKEQNKRLEKIV